MKRILCSLAVASLSFVSAQISVNESFETTPGTDKGFVIEGFASSTTPTGCNGRALSKNFWATSSNAKNTVVYSSDKSNGGKLNIAFKYKHPGASNVTPKVDGVMKIEYSVNNGEYQLLNSLDLKTHQHACQNYTTTIAQGVIPQGENFKFKITGTWVSGDYYHAIDDLVITQDALDPTLDVNASTKNQISIYPNPAHNVINLTDNKNVARLVITDVTGRTVKSIENPSLATDVSVLKSGNYIVSVITHNGETTSFKIIKK